jgi:indolepyruvate decarboxylase
MSVSFTVSDYLIARLTELGVQHLFGVPGDYNLGMLDRVLAAPGIEWVGMSNELNAAYAADGYARAGANAGTPRIGAVATTLGVGELSAINAVAGSYAESIPVVQISGAPSTKVMRARQPVHHTFGDGDYQRFSRMYAEVTCARAWLTEVDAPAEIDRVLRSCIDNRQPVHLSLPSDVALSPCARPVGCLLRPDAPAPREPRERFLATAQRLFDAAAGREVVLLAGHLAHRAGLSAQVRALVAAGQLPAAVLHRGKGVLDETHARFLGLYAGELTKPVRDIVTEAGLLITVGKLVSDGIVPFTELPTGVPTIELDWDSARADGQQFEHLRCRDALLGLTELARRRRTSEDVSTPGAPPATVPTNPVSRASEAGLDQSGLWRAIQEFLQPGDLLVAEAGTAYYGSMNLRLPVGGEFLAQGMWASIGYTLPALIGAQLASETRDRRAVLVIGDGSFQLTAQELGTFARHNLNPVIVVINNNGYTVERAIHGPTAAYNDIAAWKWTELPSALGLDGALVSRAHDARTLREALDKARANPQLPAFVEAVLPELDVPELFRAIAEAVNRRNGYQPES